jgi:glyoxylase-like metal-dependent hydrolase (beta-lactamase superfamily II)
MSSLSRREWFAMSGVAALAALGGARAEPAPVPLDSPQISNSPIYRFRVGDFRATALLAGFMDTKPTRPRDAAEEKYQRALAALGNPSHLRLPFNVLLLEHGDDRILIDAGPPKTEGKPYHLLTSLARVGLDRDAITHVLLTHAHFDHMGGLLDAENRPVFRRAAHLCFPEEVQFWTSENPDVSALQINPKALLRDARRLFSHLRFQSPEAATLPAGIHPLLSPGHTPGHMTLRIESRGETLHHISDLTHHAGFWLPHPDWSLASDTQPALAVQTRLAAFRQLADTGARVFGFHLPFPGLGKIVRVDDTFRWVPEDWDLVPV